jgi:hypothetical protein
LLFKPFFRCSSNSNSNQYNQYTPTGSVHRRSMTSGTMAARWNGYAAEHLKGDRQEAVRQDGWALRYAAPNLIGDRQEAVRQNGHLKGDRQEAVRKHGYALKWLCGSAGAAQVKHARYTGHENE